MAKTLDANMGPLDTSGLPSPNIDLPELDGLFPAGDPQGAPTGESSLGAPPTGSPPMPANMPLPTKTTGPQNMTNVPPEMKIAQGMSSEHQDAEAKAINLVTSSIRSLNQLADLLLITDEANAKTVRQMIRALGEILRTAQHEQTPNVPEL